MVSVHYLKVNRCILIRIFTKGNQKDVYKLIKTLNVININSDNRVRKQILSRYLPRSSKYYRWLVNWLWSFNINSDEKRINKHSSHMFKDGAANDKIRRGSDLFPIEVPSIYTEEDGLLVEALEQLVKVLVIIHHKNTITTMKDDNVDGYSRWYSLVTRTLTHLLTCLLTYTAFRSPKITTICRCLE